MTPTPIYFIVFIQLIAISYYDLRYRKIKNTWSLFNIVLATIAMFVFPNLYSVQVETFQFPVVIFFVGFLLYLLRIMGGGDSKFLATFFLMVPHSEQDKVFIFLLVSTVILGTLTFIKNIFLHRQKLIKSIRESDLEGVKSCFGTKFPYAPVILITWLLYGYSSYL